ncbi:MAG TPA: MauE/DoxX family redox-associated membrane protein [Candidatus Binatia bacterium]|nr:MauE/DoxX family redox-associated membrane protein [Candidatus Binatia bacterium]
MTQIDPVLNEVLALWLAAVFAVSAVMKLVDLESFAASVANYRLLPRWMEKPFASAVPLAEAASATGLSFAAARARGAAGVLALLAIFSAAIAINIARGRRDIDCGCFGAALRQGLSGWLLVRNLVLAGAAAAVWLPSFERTLVPLDWFTIALGGTTLAVLYVAANVAIVNAPRSRALEML